MTCSPIMLLGKHLLPLFPHLRDRDVEGVEEWEMGWGVPLPNRLEGLGERHELPQRGLG